MNINILADTIKNSNNILVISHFNPDPDSIGSTLFALNVLKKNFPEKNINASIEGAIPETYSFLEGFNAILKSDNISETILELKPELIIMLDGGIFGRFSREHSSEVGASIRDNSIKTIVFDHHNPEHQDPVDFYINERRSSTCEQIYLIFRDQLNLKIDIEDKKAVLFGIIDDTGRFMYNNNYHNDTFKIASELVSDGLNIEELQLHTHMLNKYSLMVVQELTNNYMQSDVCNYSFVSDEFGTKYIENGFDLGDYNIGYHFFMDNYLRNLQPFKWGYILVPDLDLGKGKYKGSFRAIYGSIDVSILAKNLNGGGHKAAAGFKLQAESIKDALEKTTEVIKANIEVAILNK